MQRQLGIGNRSYLRMSAGELRSIIFWLVMRLRGMMCTVGTCNAQIKSAGLRPVLKRFKAKKRTLTRSAAACIKLCPLT